MLKKLLMAAFLCAAPFLAHAGTDLETLGRTLPLLPLLGLGLLVLEFILPTKGALGIAGLACFVYGTFNLADHPNPSLRLGMPAIIVLNAVMLSIVGLIAAVAVRGYLSDGASDFELKGRKGVIIDWIGDNRRVEIDGQIWMAESAAVLTPGQKVRVVSQKRLILYVTPEN